MGTYYLDPNADISRTSNFTFFSSSTAWEALNDGVRQPSNSGFGTGAMANNGGFGAESLVVGVGTFTIPMGEVVTSVKLYVNYHRAKDFESGSFQYNFNLGIYVGGTLKAESGNSGTVTVTSDGQSGWHPVVTWTPGSPPSQGDVDDLRIKIESQLVACCVSFNHYRSAYLEVTTGPAPEGQVNSESVAGQVVTAEDVTGQVTSGEF